MIPILILKDRDPRHLLLLSRRFVLLVAVGARRPFKPDPRVTHPPIPLGPLNSRSEERGYRLPAQRLGRRMKRLRAVLQSGPVPKVDRGSGSRNSRVRRRG